MARGNPFPPRPVQAPVMAIAGANALRLPGPLRVSRRKRNGHRATDRQHQHQEQPEIVQPTIAPTNLHRKTPVRLPEARAVGDLPAPPQVSGVMSSVI